MTVDEEGRAMGTRVVITGAAGPLGRRVVARAAADPDVGTVVAIDRPGTDLPTGAGVTALTIELTDPDLKRACEGAAAIVHLGASQPLDAVTDAALDGTGSSVGDVEGTRSLLAAAGVAGVRTLVVLSSAMVYGAWPNNPVPLTEEAPLRPDPALRFAIEKAEIERLAGEWRDERSGHADTAVTVAMLRPTIAVASETSSWLGRSPWSAAGVQIDDAEPPAQFVHLDDLAAAVDLARRERLDGPFNVAPDGWIPAEQLRALSGPSPRVHLPAAVAERVAAMRFRFGLTGTPPSVLPYPRYSWVVANDRLKAAGWQPTHTNEEAFVEADHGGPLASLNPRKRQMIAFSVVGVVAAGLIVGVVALVRRSRRKR
jgi:nucleoside-diphosphate-sugar epimerase